MDLQDALEGWKQLGHTYVSWDTKEAYWILFVKDGDVVGHIKTVAGFISWCWPEELTNKEPTVEDFGFK